MQVWLKGRQLVVAFQSLCVECRGVLCFELYSWLFYWLF
jgi:hypothetical protein